MRDANGAAVLGKLLFYATVAEIDYAVFEDETSNEVVFAMFAEQRASAVAFVCPCGVLDEDWLLVLSDDGCDVTLIQRRSW